jgi:hypothetical protein
VNDVRYDYQLKDRQATPLDDIPDEQFALRLERLAKRLEEEDEHRLKLSTQLPH